MIRSEQGWGRSALIGLVVMVVNWVILVVFAESIEGRVFMCAPISAAGFIAGFSAARWSEDDRG